MPAVLDQVKNYEVDNLIISKNVDSTLSQNKTHFATLSNDYVIEVFNVYSNCKVATFVPEIPIELIQIISAGNDFFLLSNDGKIYFCNFRTSRIEQIQCEKHLKIFQTNTAGIFLGLNDVDCLNIFKIDENSQINIDLYLKVDSSSDNFCLSYAHNIFAFTSNSVLQIFDAQTKNPMFQTRLSENSKLKINSCQVFDAKTLICSDSLSNLYFVDLASGVVEKKFEIAEKMLTNFSINYEEKTLYVVDKKGVINSHKRSANGWIANKHQTDKKINAIKIHAFAKKLVIVSQQEFVVSSVLNSTIKMPVGIFKTAIAKPFMSDDNFFIPSMNELNVYFPENSELVLTHSLKFDQKSFKILSCAYSKPYLAIGYQKGVLLYKMTPKKIEKINIQDKGAEIPAPYLVKSFDKGFVVANTQQVVKIQFRGKDSFKFQTCNDFVDDPIVHSTFCESNSKIIFSLTSLRKLIFDVKKFETEEEILKKRTDITKLAYDQVDNSLIAFTSKKKALKYDLTKQTTEKFVDEDNEKLMSLLRNNIDVTCHQDFYLFTQPYSICRVSRSNLAVINQTDKKTTITFHFNSKLDLISLTEIQKRPERKKKMNFGY